MGEMNNTIQLRRAHRVLDHLIGALVEQQQAKEAWSKVNMQNTEEYTSEADDIVEMCRARLNRHIAAAVLAEIEADQ
jgi:hypothetical protein